MKRWTLMLALLALPAGAPAAAGAADLDLDLYARILDRYTRPVEDTARTRVDYRGLTRAPEWKQLVASLAAVDPDALGSREERLAFWINAYNILAIDVVVENYPVASIRDVGSFLSPVWKREAGQIHGRAYTLDEIEHRILRPMGEPRVHVAIVCASTSCPGLLREPWRPETLEAQLDGAMRAWLADTEKGLRIDESGRTVYLSKIFRWFSEDFEKRGGVIEFAKAYAPEPARRWLEANGARASVRYMDYDWNLNGLPG